MRLSKHESLCDRPSIGALGSRGWCTVQETAPVIRAWKAATFSRGLFQLKHENERSHKRPSQSFTFDGSDMHQIREMQGCTRVVPLVTIERDHSMTSTTSNLEVLLKTRRWN